MNEPSSLAKLPGGGGGSGTLALHKHILIHYPLRFVAKIGAKAPKMNFFVSNRDCLITIHITHRLFIGLQKAYTIYKS